MSVGERTTHRHRGRKESISEASSMQQHSNYFENSSQVIRAGNIQKETESFIRSWEVILFLSQTCYCVLTQKKLLCFSDESRIKMVSCLNFKKVDCQIKVKDDEGLVFRLTYGDDQIGHTLRAETRAEAERWIEDIQAVIKSFINQPKLKIRKGSQELYHHQDTLLQE